MRLLVTTPVAVVTDVGDVRHVRAEDETGAFGILPGHADFVTPLTISVLSWRNHSDEEHFVAVRGGVLSVQNGDLVAVATREAVTEDTLNRLGDSVLDRFREEAEAEERARIAATRLHLAAIRQLQRYLASGHGTMSLGATSRFAEDGGEGESA